jgi:hypothetical protein
VVSDAERSEAKGADRPAALRYGPSGGPTARLATPNGLVRGAGSMPSRFRADVLPCGDHQRVPDVLFAPYLALSESVEVGPWHLLPFKTLDAADVVPNGLRRPVERLVDAYRVDSGAGGSLGAIVFPIGGQVGTAFDRSSMPLLGHALLAGTVANNPLMTLPEAEQSPNAGHAIATAENAAVFGHPVANGDSYVVETGVLARVLAYRSAPADEPLPKVEPPVELPKPIFGGFDEEVATAAHAALNANDPSGRRLHRALDWYRIALSNAESVTLDVRVGAARSALEVLTDAGDSTRRLVRAYGKLVRDAATGEQTYPDVFWANGPVQLTPDEWWMTRLCELRNAIVHGDEVPGELWQHDAHHHLSHIHDRLIGALKAVVADHAGDALLRLSRSDRVFPRIAEELAERLRHEESTPDDA